MIKSNTKQLPVTTSKQLLHSSQTEGKPEWRNSQTRFIFMVQTCVEVRVHQIMQKFYTISLINGRPLNKNKKYLNQKIIE